MLAKKLLAKQGKAIKTPIYETGVDDTFVVPAGVNRIEIWAIGGGGGGAFSTTGGCSGGYAGEIVHEFRDVIQDQGIEISIGNGANDGSNGNETIVDKKADTPIYANGGNGGKEYGDTGFPDYPGDGAATYIDFLGITVYDGLHINDGYDYYGGQAGFANAMNGVDRSGNYNGENIPSSKGAGGAGTGKDIGSSTDRGGDGYVYIYEA